MNIRKFCDGSDEENGCEILADKRRTRFMRLQKAAKRVAAAAIAGMMAASLTFPAAAATGWSQVADKRYYYHPDGSMATGLMNLDGTYYYFLADGSMVTGWLKLNGEFYYMQENGALTTGWKQLDGEWYYLRPDSGKCVINSAVEIDGYWYFFKSDGKKLTGWLKKDGGFYYLDPAGEGRMVAGTTRMIDGASYSFEANGLCTSTGFVNNYYDVDAAAGRNSSQTSSYQSTSSGSRVVVAGSERTNDGPGVSAY